MKNRSRAKKRGRNASINVEANSNKKNRQVEGKDQDKNSITQAKKLYEAAKQKWLYPQNESDYEVQVKKLLRKSIRILENDNQSQSQSQSQNQEEQEAKFSLHTQANDALTLLCIQISNSNPKEVNNLLRDGGYVARLSKDVLRYKLPSEITRTRTAAAAAATVTEQDGNHNNNNTSASSVACPCHVYDDALPTKDLNVLMKALCPEDSSYWKDHAYSVYPPTPYFSYAFDLRDETLNQLGALGEHVKNVRRLSSGIFDEFTDEATAQYAEIWAHHRPHCSGHQLHFDSDNEGRGEVKHPLVSSIIYLSDEGCGGPSLMTDQRLGDNELAQNGWLAYPKKNRLVVFDGSVLHGVIPGRGFVGHRKRVTLMVALWKDIRIRKGKEPGAARPLPMLMRKRKDDATSMPEWFQYLTSKGDDKDVSKNTAKKVEPERLGCVFSTRKGKPIREGQMPHYDTVFQGF
uniref:Uncharacterized protein n=1 Tax=Chaetoceros debilis TaxID=122233 RepID=A0A7S3VG20_9STRA|mmetsp:Transcript_20343/g.30002  ORF Transcript_20343/g.30002 Transcript_20343/m.30002 type:complete len:461 (+) Transcript_20343:149-1531(+)